jgi:hypothetical protein
MIKHFFDMIYKLCDTVGALNGITLGQNTFDSNKRMIPLTEFLFPMYKPLLKLMGLAEVPKSDSIIQLIPLSVIPLSGAHCGI